MEKTTEREVWKGDAAAASVCHNSETGRSGEAKEDGRLLLVLGEGLPRAALEPDAMPKLSAVTV